MPLQDILQGDYTLSNSYFQIKLPIDLEPMIPADDPVRLLSACVEGMDLSELYDTYDRIRKNQATPKQLFKIIVYANMNRLYSSRDIEKACRQNINYMYLLEGKPAPDHATIARFHSLHFSQCSKKIMAETTWLLRRLGEVGSVTVFIDGTKIEANANRYTFVWKKAVTKNLSKMMEKVTSFVAECEALYGLRIVYHDSISMNTLKRLLKSLYRVKADEGIEFVHGSGKRKSPLQRSVEQLEKYIDRLEGYSRKLEVCGERNSYSKTDTDATFMRLKEDAMLNGQLKPAYNLQHAVDSEYIVWADISAHPTDTLTLKPFLQDMEKGLCYKYSEIVADAGYESEENYLFIEENGQTSYIKPSNYEISRTRKYRTDIGRHENMTYDADRDVYTCKNGKELKVTGTETRKSKSGYKSTVTIYRCNDCKGCPYKTQCIKGNNCKTPMEERCKSLHISKIKEQKRKEDLERILSDRGIQLRVNRSIQVEGSFATVKEDMNFRQYLYRGNRNVLAQSILVAIAHNINKLHHRIQSGRTGTHLFPLKKTG